MIDHPADPAERIIVALDVADERDLERLVRPLRGRVGLFKIGKELFTALGPRAVELVRVDGGEVFLDLKYHDIPNTVSAAVRSAVRLGVTMVTVHASGGRAMIEAACRAAAEVDQGVRIVAVTLLTSLSGDDLIAMGLEVEPSAAVERLARMGLEAGVHGLVASAWEVAMLRSHFGTDPLLIVPGIRPPEARSDDQARVASPSAAVAAGADYLVIGRPITRAADPAAALEAIVAEMRNRS